MPRLTALRALLRGAGSRKPITREMATVAIAMTTGRQIAAVRGNVSNATSQPKNSAIARAAIGSTAYRPRTRMDFVMAVRIGRWDRLGNIIP